MNPQPKSSTATIVAIFSAAVLFTTYQVVAQSPRSKTTTTWQDLGYNQLPKGFSTEEISLFEGLNEARGTWSFEGEIADGEAATPLQGSLQIVGNSKAGMVPFWKMAWRWPADDPGLMINYNVIASPGKTRFDLTLVQVGPVKVPTSATTKPTPTIFKGTWNLENRTIAWTESDLPTRRGGQAAKEDTSRPRRSFEMVVGTDGKVSIGNCKHASQGQMLGGKALLRTGKAPADPVTLTGKHSFKTVAEISDQRIRPCLPPQAKEISVLSERSGHLARYKVNETDFIRFLDELWEAKKDGSAHKRDEMSGEGEPANRETMAIYLKATGWKPLDNAITYFSPSKRSGAMTTYYYDRESGIAYHDAGYW